MTKLTSEQIETTITQSHANILAVAEVSRDSRVIDPCITRELRACFTAGVDHGTASVLERASELMGDNVATTQEAQLGRAAVAVFAWCEARTGRFLGCQGGAGGHHYGSVFVADGEPLPSAESQAKYFYGASHAEVLSKMGTWCIEQMGGARSDTIPAPPPIGGSHCAELAPKTERERLQKVLELVNEAHTLVCLADDTVATEQGWWTLLEATAEHLACSYTNTKTALERAK